MTTSFIVSSPWVWEEPVSMMWLYHFPDNIVLYGREYFTNVIKIPNRWLWVNQKRDYIVSAWPNPVSILKAKRLSCQPGQSKLPCRERLYGGGHVASTWGQLPGGESGPQPTAGEIWKISVTQLNSGNSHLSLDKDPTLLKGRTSSRQTKQTKQTLAPRLQSCGTQTEELH